MKISAELLQAIQYSSASPLLPWTVELVHAIPELLVALLSQAQGHSLERLQLLSMDITISNDVHQHMMPKLRNVSITRFGAQTEFLTVRGELMLDDGRMLTVAVNYYRRGQRKFFRPEAFAHEVKLSATFLPITRDDVKTFFLAIEQPNSFFVDQELAQLNGRPDVIIPSQMLLLLLLGHSEPIFGQTLSFHARFYRAVKLGEVLSLSIGNNVSALMLESVPVLSLQCT